jgi:hypothetical protein
MKPLTENQIQQQVVVLLESYCRNDVTWFGVPNGEFRFPKTAARLKAQGVRPGAPDLVVLSSGIFYGLELKRDSGRLADSQRSMGAEITRAGGIYYVCYGLEEAVQCLMKIDVFRPGFKFTFRDNGVD